MKINKSILKKIIKEELEGMQELEQAPPEAGQEQEQASPIQGRVEDALNKWKAGESVLKTIDDPKEVIQLVVGIFQHLNGLNPDLSPSEVGRTIDLMRTKVLPDMKRGLK